MQTEQKKDIRSGAILTSVGVVTLMLPIILTILIGPILDSIWLVYLVPIAFFSLGLAYIIVFVRKGRRTISLLFGAIVGPCFLCLSVVFISLLLFFTR